MANITGATDFNDPRLARSYEDKESDVAVRETSLEEDLNTLEQQYRELQSIQATIYSTKKRIENKNDSNGQRIGKLYEAIALSLRGESVPTERAQW